MVQERHGLKRGCIGKTRSSGCGPFGADTLVDDNPASD
jgi:hypothetical protein